MTPASLLHFVEALLWCGLVFVSVAGYGAVLLRAFGVRRPAVSMAVVCGVGTVIFLGGWLNLARAVTGSVLAALIVVGVAAAILLRVSLGEPGATAESGVSRPPSSRTVSLLLILFAVIFVVRLGATVHAGQYQASDDYNFYLAAPSKMLQLHHYAADPFSERRVMSSIGGNYFLQDMVLAALPLRNVQMADRTLGLILMAFLAYGLGDEFGLSRLQRIVFAILVFFTPQLQFNLTFVQLPCALFFGLVYLAANRRALAERPALLGFLLGTVTGAAATMKSTYLPHGVMFVGCLALLHWRRRGLGAGVKTLLPAALGAFAVMLPWMIASHATSGTYFYPSLGAGYQYSAYGLYPAPSGAGVGIILHKVIPFCIPLLLLFLIEWFLGDRDEQGEAILALSGAAFLAALLIGIATGGDSVRRYNYPCMLPAIVLLYVVFTRRVNTVPAARRWRVLQRVTVGVVAAGALTIWGNRFTNEFLQIPRALRLGLRDAPIVPASVYREYAAMQRALPTDEGTLATVGDSFLLDFRAHSIDIADYPGAASLPPGWPSRQDGDALAGYLLAHHLRYLVYHYADFAGFDEGAPHVIADSSRTQWIHSEAEITLRSHQQYAELAGSRRRLYDDGRMYVLDLAERVNGQGSGLDPGKPPKDSLTAGRSPR